MIPSIATFPEKKFIGHRMIMSFAKNRTYELWSGFMPRRNQIQNSIGSELYSMEVFPERFFDNFDPGVSFAKWAAVEVTDFNTVPNGMETFIIPEGLYAVFLHKGPASEGPKTYEYIFTTWLPTSDYVLDERPHFAIMGEKYKQNDPNSEEELWIPVKPV